MSYTNGLDKPSDYFNTKLYTGTGSSLGVTGVGFQPDWVWIKGRSGATEHVLTDSVRGVTEELSSNDNGAEETVAQGLTAFNSDGFTVGTDGSYNTSSATYASWNWLASNTTASNTDGSITSTVSANTTSGFSIVSYTGTGATATVGHGLGVAPEMIIVKRRDSGVGNTIWGVGSNQIGWGYKLYLHGSDAKVADTDIWANTAPTSSVISLSTDVESNGSGGTFIAYCFADTGNKFFKSGSYTGNGNADGTFVYTGFKPAFIITKRTDSTSSWQMYDNKRLGYNVDNDQMRADTSDAEDTSDDLDILSNGFKMRNTGAAYNASGGSYIYMAFAENPFVTSTGIPTTAR